MAVRVGLVGTGRRAAEAHAPALAASPDLEFAGVWGRSTEAVRDLANRHGVTPYARFDDLVAHVDAVAFAIPPAAQAEYAADAARHGKAILLERPIAGDGAGAEQLVIAIDGTRVISQLALMWRYTDEVRHFLADEVPRTEIVGGVGRLISSTLATGSGVPAWRARLGVLRNEGTDLLDLLDAALGTITGVRAHGDSQGWVGLLLDHLVGRASEASMYPLAAPGTHRAEVEVFGRNGTAAVDCTNLVQPPVYRAMYREFADAVAHGSPHELDVARGMHLQQVLEGAETDLVVGV